MAFLDFTLKVNLNLPTPELGNIDKIEGVRKLESKGNFLLSHAGRPRNCARLQLSPSNVHSKTLTRNICSRGRLPIPRSQLPPEDKSHVQSRDPSAVFALGISNWPLRKALARRLSDYSSSSLIASDNTVLSARLPKEPPITLHFSFPSLISGFKYCRMWVASDGDNSGLFMRGKTLDAPSSNFSDLEMEMDMSMEDDVLVDVE
ncbi:hypothetical protein CC78DRAFT_547505 [Lojkania enalia]|uniref:Uncharacterized protein n=1 Tax=Lojkania enalia TaxID=147567 RepID=A0A9P4K5B7_9PLEO|nr:hypothetical protein CC78DRAFT_547505 [Didymosphaeria enalia]